MNKIILIGRVGKDPETKNFDTFSLTSFSLATTERFKTNNEIKTNTTWHNIICSGKIAEIVQKHVKKGDQLFLEGKQINRTYDKDGETKYISEVRLNNIEFLGGRKDGGSDNDGQVEDLPF